MEQDLYKTSFANYPDVASIREYKKIAMEMLQLNFPKLYKDELASAIDISISNHFQNTNARIDNNYKNKTVETDLANVVNYIDKNKPIINSYGTLFKRHGLEPNPIYDMIMKFTTDRSNMKKIMFKYPVGSEDFEKYNLLQLLLKLDANAYYGAVGMPASIYFNIYCASAITKQGRSCNAAAALFFESFLNNNVPFSSINEVVEFIYNVSHEQHFYKYTDIISIHPSLEDVFFKVMSSTGFGYVPTMDDMYIVWEQLEKFDQDTLDRIYYKNNLFRFIENDQVFGAIVYILQTLKTPFLDPNNPNEEIKEALKAFCEILKEFVYYDKQIIDRIDKMDALIRSVSIIQDTDSCIVSIDGWYQYVRTACSGIPMAIKNVNVDAAEYTLTGNVKISEPFDKVEEYSFLDDSIIERDRLIDPMIIIPQDGLRYSIINIMSYCITILANDYMEKYCSNSNTRVEGRQCFISLKNEFLFKRILITDAKKHYASKIELKEGHQVPEDKSLDIKGMDAFIKSSTNPAIQERLKEILYDEVINADYVDQIEVLRSIATLEKDIFDSINSGEKKFFKPAKVKSASSYDDPMRIQGISASYAYNHLHQEGTEAIDLTKQNSVDIVKVDMNAKNIDRIRDSYPDVYEKALLLFNDKSSKFFTGISSIAIPENEPIPGWILPFIEYWTIINDNVSGFPIEEICIKRGNSSNNSTNIINF